MQVLTYQHSRGLTKVLRIESFDQCDREIHNQSCKTFIVCDVYFKSVIKADYYLEASEKYKTIDTALEICEAMSQKKIKRSDKVTVIGGGVVGDTAGFACSIYLRGVDWDFYPTTLLSQVDSCLGGKVAVNTLSGKNLLGQFHHPKTIFLISSFLETLPAEQILSGWGEIFKYQELSKSQFQSQLSLVFDYPKIPSGEIVDQCLKIKVDYIKNDEFDSGGGRALLNLGHTLGHAIESSLEYTVSHGEAVWWGMMFESFYASSDFSLCDALLLFQPLHTQSVLDLEAKQLIKYMKKDKKGEMNFIISLGLKQISEVDFEQTWNIFRAKFKVYEDHINRN